MRLKRNKSKKDRNQLNLSGFDQLVVNVASLTEREWVVLLTNSTVRTFKDKQVIVAEDKPCSFIYRYTFPFCAMGDLIIPRLLTYSSLLPFTVFVANNRQNSGYFYCGANHRLQSSTGCSKDHQHAVRRNGERDCTGFRYVWRVVLDQ